MPVNKEAIAEWVTALRSGNYEQTTGQLVSTIKVGDGIAYGYCCLGVACSVFAERVGLTHDDDGEWFVWTEDDGSRQGEGMNLPRQVADLLGVDVMSPDVKVSDPSEPKGWYSASLIELNDEEHFDFNQIADAIEFTWLRDDKVPDAVDPA